MSKRFEDLDSNYDNFNGNDKIPEDNSSTSGSSGPRVTYFERKDEKGRIILTEEMAPEVLGFAFSERKKYLILTIIAILQISMNFNTSIYPNAVGAISEEWGVSEQAARVGQMGFLVEFLCLMRLRKKKTDRGRYSTRSDASSGLPGLRNTAAGLSCNCHSFLSTSGR